MKKIAILVYDYSSDYVQAVLQGIIDYFNEDKKVQTIVAQIRRPFSNEGTYSYQHWVNAELLKSDDIDAYIILSSVFGDCLDTVLKRITKNNSKPIISVGINPKVRNSVYTYNNCEKVYGDLIRHLRRKHHCEKIGFYSAIQSGSKEAEDRYQSFLRALKKQNMEIDPECVVEGNFLEHAAIEQIVERYKGMEKLPFDAFICSNDLTASGAITAFNQLGFKVPEDVIVIGFDNSAYATMTNPTISSIDQQMEAQGTKAAELAYKIVNGETVPKRNTTKLSLYYRQSCGCIRMNNKDSVYKNQKGKLFFQAERYKAEVNNYYHKLQEFDNLLPLYDNIRSTTTRAQLAYSLPAIISKTSFNTLLLCLYDKPIELQQNELFIRPESVNVEALVKINNNQVIFQPGITFNPRNQLVPDSILDDSPGNYIIHNVSSGSKVYGYMIAGYRWNNFSAYNLFLKIISQAVTQSVEYTKTLSVNQKLETEKKELVEKTEDLSIQNRTDDLTKILNRRSFLEYGQRLIDFSVDVNNFGLVFFADLDGLKMINDNYGHEFGDKAIQNEAEVLKEAFRQSDIVGRLSGDEFAIIAPGISISSFAKIHRKIDKINKKKSKELKFPFVLSISLGAVPFNKEDCDLKKLLAKADSKLYEEKKIKHTQK